MISGCLIIFIYMDLTLFQDEVRVLQGYRVLKVDGNFKRRTLQHFAASDYIFCFVPRATEGKHHYLVEGKHGVHTVRWDFHREISINLVHVTHPNATIRHGTLPELDVLDLTVFVFKAWDSFIKYD